MMKNIVLGALAGAAVAIIIMEKKNHKSIEQGYHQLGEYLVKMRHKVMDGFEKGKHQAECLGDRAGKMIHNHMKG